MFPTAGTPSALAYADARRVMPGGSTRQALYAMTAYAERGEGCRIRDIDGQWHLDALNNFMVLIHGHRHQPTLAALEGKLETGLCFGLPTTSEIALASHLAARVPSVEQIVFCNSGSEAVMHAMKAARALTRRPKIVKCEGLYHGSYDFAEVSNAPPIRPGTQEPPQPVGYGPYTSPAITGDTIILPFNNLDLANQIIAQHGDEIAGLILDPFPSRIGYARASDEFVNGLRSLCDAHGILFIFDEVASFRVAWGGAQSLYDVKPDLTVFGQLIGGGLAVGAVGGTSAAMSIFDPGQKNYLSITGTFNANPLTMVAGLACLEDFTPDAVERLNEEGEFLRNSLSSEVQARGLPVEITGNASFVAAFFGKRKRTEYHSAAPGAEERNAISLYAEIAFRRGILIDTTGRLNLSTAFTRRDVEEASEILADALEHVCNSDVGAFLKETP